MTGIVEPTNLGLSEKAHAKLKRLRDDGHFAEMVDAYRCGIALALAHGVAPGEIVPPRTNVFGVATVDPDKEIATAIRAVLDTSDTPIYRMAERLAEWGIEELHRRASNGEIDFGTLLEEAENLKAN